MIDLMPISQHYFHAQVFEDEAQGICCYRAPSGEVTCEGHDEGPHFQPAACCDERYDSLIVAHVNFVVGAHQSTPQNTR